MDTVHGQRPDSALDTSTPLQLVRAAAALRWKRPDLTATLAELALDCAGDAGTWAAAAGWLLHGRNAIGDGREVACELLDGLERWGGVALITGPEGRLLRVGLAGPARRAGEPADARALLGAEPGPDDLDDVLRPDVLTELARCAVDDAPDTADAALDAAEQAWHAAGCEPGIASVLLLRATHHRRAGRPDAAAAVAASGLARVNADGRRTGSGGSDHLAAALTAEWIAALVDAGRMDEARGEAARAAATLVSTGRPTRQRAGLRLAVARVTAVGDGTDAVLAALEPAAGDAAESDVPDLESACRSMLGELHEAAGRLDEALTAVRAAMAAERRDHDRGARLRRRLTAATATWAAAPSEHGTARRTTRSSSDASTMGGTDDKLATDRGRVDRADEMLDVAVGSTGAVGSDHLSSLDTAPASDSTDRPRRPTAKWDGATGPGRRARRLAAESVGWSDAALPELGTAAAGRSGSAGEAPDTAVAPTTRVPDTAIGAPASQHDSQRWDAVSSSTAWLGSMPDLDRPSPEPGGKNPFPDASSPGPAAYTVSRRHGRSAPTATTTDTGRSVAVGASAGSGSLIGDALFRELVENPGPRPDASPHGSHVAESAGGYAERSASARRNGHGPDDHSRAGRDGHRSDDQHAHRSGSTGPSEPRRRQQTDPSTGDTVVFDRDPRLDSPPPAAPTGAPQPHSLPDGGSEPSATDARRPAASGRVADDTIRVGTAVRGDGRSPRNGLCTTPPPSAHEASATGAPAPPGSPPAASMPGGGDRRRGGRPRQADADGPGLGDLLADALAAFRNI